VGKVSALIQKKEQPPPINLVRTTIQPDKHYAVTLCFLATGETFHSLEFSFRISRQKIYLIISETTHTENDWETVGSKFESRWDFPNGIGAIDRKQVVMQKPFHLGSRFYDYKGKTVLALFWFEYQCF